MKLTKLKPVSLWSRVQKEEMIGKINFDKQLIANLVVEKIKRR